MLARLIGNVHAKNGNVPYYGGVRAQPISTPTNPYAQVVDRSEKAGALVAVEVCPGGLCPVAPSATLCPRLRGYCSARTPGHVPHAPASHGTGILAEGRTSSMEAPTMLLTGHDAPPAALAPPQASSGGPTPPAALSCTLPCIALHQTGEIFTMGFAPDGEVLASAGFDKNICSACLLHPHATRPRAHMHACLPSAAVLWKSFGDCENFAVLKGHTNAVLQLDWAPDGQRGRLAQRGGLRFLYTCSADKTLGIWDVEYLFRYK
eukprot:gene3405-3884_t